MPAVDAFWLNWFSINLGPNVMNPLTTKEFKTLNATSRMKTGLVKSPLKSRGRSLISIFSSLDGLAGSPGFPWASLIWEARILAAPVEGRELNLLDTCSGSQRLIKPLDYLYFLR